MPLLGVTTNSRAAWGKPEVKVAFGVGMLEDLEKIEAATVTEAVAALSGPATQTPAHVPWWEATPGMRPNPKPRTKEEAQTKVQIVPPPLPGRAAAVSSPTRPKSALKGAGRASSPAKQVPDPPFSVTTTSDGCYQLTPPSSDPAFSAPVSDFALKITLLSARNLFYLADPSKPNTFVVSLNILGSSIRTDLFVVRTAGPRVFTEADCVASFAPEIATIKLRAAPGVLRRWLRQGLEELPVKLCRLTRDEKPETVAVAEVGVGGELADRLEFELAAKATVRASYAFSLPDGSAPNAPEDAPPSVEVMVAIEHRASKRFFNFLDDLEQAQSIESKPSGQRLCSSLSQPSHRSKTPSPEEPPHRFRISVDIRAVRDLHANQHIYLRYHYPPLGSPSPFTLHPALSTGPTAGAEVPILEGGFASYDVQLSPVRLDTYLSGLPLEMEVWIRDPAERSKDSLLGNVRISMERFSDEAEHKLMAVKRTIDGREVASKIWDSWHRIENGGRKRGEIRLLLAVEDFGQAGREDSERQARPRDKQVQLQVREEARAASPTRRSPDDIGPADISFALSEGTAKPVLRRQPKPHRLQAVSPGPPTLDEATSTRTLAGDSAEQHGFELARAPRSAGSESKSHQLGWEADMVIRLEAESRARETERERQFQKKLQHVTEVEERNNTLYAQLLERERAVQRAEDEAQRILMDLEREKERQEREWDDRAKRWDETRAHHANLERARLEMAEERIRRTEKDREDAEEARRRSEREMQRLQARILEQQHQLLQLQQVTTGKDLHVDTTAIAAAAASAASSSAEIAFLTTELHRMEARCEDLSHRLEKERAAAQHYRNRYGMALAKLGEYRRLANNFGRSRSLSRDPEPDSHSKMVELGSIRKELDDLRRSINPDRFAQADSVSAIESRPVTRANTETRSRGLNGSSTKDEWDEALDAEIGIAEETFPVDRNLGDGVVWDSDAGSRGLGSGDV